MPGLGPFGPHPFLFINQLSKHWLANPAKTEALYFGNDQPPTLNLNNIQLTANSSHQHLGVTLDSNGKWSPTQRTLYLQHLQHY